MEHPPVEPLPRESFLDRVERSRLGNILLVVHSLFQIREVFLRRPIDWYAPWNYVPVSDPEAYCDWSPCYRPSFGEVFYNLIHLPTWIAIWLFEWIAKPLWDNLWVIAAQQLELGLFVFVGAIQWLVLGYVAETWWARRALRPGVDPQLSIAPEAVWLRPADSEAATGPALD
jgi:hypothetical protein